MAAYQFYIHFSDIKFYCTLYFGEAVGRDRSLSVAYNITDGVKCLTISLGDLSAQDEAEIQPKDFPINIAFNDLSLTLKSVSITCSFDLREFHYNHKSPSRITNQSLLSLLH